MEKIPIPIGCIFKCNLLNSDTDFFFCRNYCIYYEGNSNNINQGFFCNNNKNKRLKIKYCYDNSWIDFNKKFLKNK